MGMMELSVLASVTACTGMTMLVWIFQELGGTKLLGFSGVEAEKVNKERRKEPDLATDMAGLAPDEQDVFTTYNEVYDSFDSMGLQENLLKGIYAYGFKKPFAIQKRGIVSFCKGRDVIQQAQSGTGKTTTFCCGILQQIDYGLVQCQALVLTPTCNLAGRTTELMRALGNYLGVKVHACAGQTSIFDQHILQAGVHVVVGSPDPVFDMLRRKALCPEYIKMFVLDDAHEMLTEYSSQKIFEIYTLLRSKIQIGMFSTMSLEALKLTRGFMVKPVKIVGKHEELTMEELPPNFADLL